MLTHLLLIPLSLSLSLSLSFIIPPSPSPSLSLPPPSLQVKLQQQESGEEELKDPDMLVQESDSQYGTWETGLHTDDRYTHPQGVCGAAAQAGGPRLPFPEPH